MKINDTHYLKKKNFVAELGKVLNIAKPHLVSCEFKLGEELPIRQVWAEKETADGTVYTVVDHQPEGEFVVVTCDNGYKYEIDVSADSLAAIGEEVFRKMVCK